MSTQDINEKSIRAISFSGKKSDWRVWSCKFLAHANRLGYNDLLKGKVKVPKEFEYDAAKIKTSPNDNEKYLVKRWKLNERAFEEILLSIDGKTQSGHVAFNLIEIVLRPINLMEIASLHGIVLCTSMRPRQLLHSLS
jgi:hypothetical protein